MACETEQQAKDDACDIAVAAQADYCKKVSDRVAAEQALTNAQAAEAMSLASLNVAVSDKLAACLALSMCQNS